MSALVLHASILLALLITPARAGDDVADLVHAMRDARRDGRAAAALALLDGRSDTWRADTRVVGEQVQSLLDLQRVDEARAADQAAGDLTSASLPYFVGHTRLQLLGSDPEPILDAVDRLLATRPGHADLLALRVHALCALARWPDAVTQVELLSGEVPAAMRRTLRVDVLLAKGRAHAELPDELERAIPLLDQALSLDPTRIDVRTELALALAQWHRSERAAELVQEALDDAAGADRCELLFALGMVRRAELNDAEAEACFRTVLADHPDHSRAAAALAGCWMRSGRSDEARQLLAASLARDPDDVRALFVLAELEMTEGAADRSEAALRAILAVNPASLKALYMLSRSLAMQGREEEQLAILQSYSERRGQLASR